MIGLIDEIVKKKITARTHPHFLKYYEDIEIGDVINIKTSELNKGSYDIVKCECQECGSIVEVPFIQYMRCKKGFVCSSKCRMKRTNRSLKSEFGVDNISQLKEVKEKKKESAIEKYGVDNISKSDVIKEQKKQSSLRVYGVENISQSEEIKIKKKATCKENYGVEHALQSPEYMVERIKKLQFKYGDDITNISQVAEIMDKKFMTGMTPKQYIMPSGNVIKYQGNENFGLDYLLKNGYVEDDIVIGNQLIENEIGKIMFYDWTDKKKRYFPDIYIKSENKIYEVKSTYTINIDIELIKRKMNSVIEHGYGHEFLIFDAKGKLIENIDIENIPQKRYSRSLKIVN